MENKNTIAWDIGGANLKLASLDCNGVINYVDQIEMPLWKGLDMLEQAVKSLPESILDKAQQHAITMTGELVDTFPDRISGVRKIVNKFTEIVDQKVYVYAATKGWLESEAIKGNETHIASTNWHATASYIAQKIENGLMIDIGSTTTDIIAIIDGKPANIGQTDHARMQNDELVYSGVDRTSVAAIVSRVPFAGEWQQIATEYFSSVADVYCLTGDLPENAGFSTADGKGTSLFDCARRLARISGQDLHDAEIVAWQQLAKYIAQQHLVHIDKAVSRVRSRYPSDELQIIGAGVGRFLIRRLAAWHNYSYYDFADLVEGEEMLKQAAAICAPATACAYLL